MHNPNDLAGAMQGLRIKTIIEQDAERMMKDEGIHIGKAVMPKKLQGTPGTIPFDTNVYGMTMKNTLVYRYELNCVVEYTAANNIERALEVSQKFKGDVIAIERRDCCRDIFQIFERYGIATGFLKPNTSAYYDLEAVLYSLFQIDMSMIPGDGLVFQNTGDFALPDRWNRYTRFIVKIRPVKNSFILELNDLSGVSAELEDVENRLAQFLDVATAQHAFFNSNDFITFSAGTSYLLNPGQHGFDEQRDMVTFEDVGGYLGFGAQKSVRYIEAPDKSTTDRAMGLVVQSRRTPFHTPHMPLDVKAAGIVGGNQLQRLFPDTIAKLKKHLKGLFVEIMHSERMPQPKFEIQDVTGTTARTQMFTLGDQEITVEQYFLHRYGIQLAQPDIPLVVARGREGPRYFPMELCAVCDNQRVKGSQMTSKATAEMIRKCAIQPIALREQDQRTAGSLNLWNSKYLHDAGVDIAKRPIQVYGRSLEFPQFKFGGAGRPEPINQQRYTWGMGRAQYLHPAIIEKWSVYSFIDGRREQREFIDEQLLREFIKRYLMEARSRGIQIPDPTEVVLPGSNDSKVIQQCFTDACSKGVTFIMAIHGSDASGNEPHNEIKRAERRTEVISQCIRSKVIRSVIERGQRETISNICHKTNVKHGGLNYSLILNGTEPLPSNTLFIGIASNQPGFGGGSQKTADKTDVNDFKLAGAKGEAKIAPSVVGYAYNGGATNGFEFIGDFLYQAPLRNEKTSVITEIVGRCVDGYLKQTHRSDQKHLANLVLLRNDVEEGQFAHVLKFDVPMVKAALAKRNCLNTTLTVIVANKRSQGIRFYPSQINPQERNHNIKPGTVIDAGITHPVFPEWYGVSALALQGTARVPKYNLLVNEANLELPKLENIVNLLCFGHQIVYLPVSLPAPIYIANRFAERGRKLYTSWIASEHPAGHNLTYQQLTIELGYSAQTRFLSHWRINA